VEVRVVGLIDDAIERLKDMLVSGELKPGDRLPIERDLAVRLGVSRNSVREAVRALTTLRVLQARQGDGTYVTSLEPKVLFDAFRFVVDLHHDAEALNFFEVRRFLEPKASAAAAIRIDEATLDQLADLVDQAELLSEREDRDQAALVDLDQRFHGLINAASGNPVLAAVIEGMSGQTTRARYWRGNADSGAASRTVAEHRAILAALRAHDPEAARLRSEIHIAGVEDWLRGILSASAPKDEQGDWDALTN
jgi:DNA-binding FadR family transcriptional regulator